MSKLLPARVLISTLTFAIGVASAVADDGRAPSPWSFDFAATRDYRFRGISQSDNDPALQGSVTYIHASGFFANVWASTIDFEPFDDASVEVDLTAGFIHAFSPATEGTIKVTYYAYPN